MTITTSSNDSARTGVAGVPRAIWIGGALMGLTIIALATTLVVRSNDSLPADTAAPATSTASAAAATSPGAPPPGMSSVAQGPAPAVADAPAPVRTPQTPTNTATAAATENGEHAPQQVASVPVCANCGVIESYSAVQVQGQNNGVGAVAGGVGGALIGSKIAGRGNHTLGGILGAVGGGLLGNAIETHQRTTTVYDVHVRMHDGTLRTVRQATLPTVGAPVKVEGHVLHALHAQG